ncbi:MAG: hypothetical protein ACRCR1_05410 [Aeromonas sp.]
MNLTEGQLFTIEALNRIDGFVWPDKAEFAAMDDELFTIDFYSLKPEPLSDSLSFGSKFWMRAYNGKFKSKDHHPDWRNSLITREQFDSVDGWVRNNGDKIIFSGDYDVNRNGSVIRITGVWTQDSDVMCWRYHKPTKETEMQPEAPKQPSIDELYSQYKTQRSIVESAKKTLADEMEAEDKLLEQIKAWNLEYGFDVRLLDESEEKPELVITDWRDLQVGDIVEVIKVSKMSEIRRYKEMIGRHLPVIHTESPGVEDQPVQVNCDGKLIFISKWKFIRRP